MIKKIFLSLLLLFAVLLAGCSSKNQEEISKTTQVSEDTQSELTEISAKLRDDAITFEFDYLYEIASDTFKSAITKETLSSALKESLVTSGEFISLEKTEVTANGDYTAVVEYLRYENTGVLFIFTFNKDNHQIEGFNINYYQLEENIITLPENLVEKDLNVVTGEYSLPAILTQNSETETKSVVLLIHGSGPNDMDETILGTSIFKDIAYNLPLMGVDVFRYDKRTNVYSENLSPNGDEYFTVHDEVIQDALSAAKILKEEGYENVYLAGHSLGAILGPRIIAEQPELFTGFISLAGSPNTLSDIIINQNDMAIKNLSGEQKEIGLELLNVEIEKLNNLDNFSEEELLQTTIFGFSAYYIKEANSYDTLTIAKNLDIPMLFLQGSEDFQVTVDFDYNAWKTGLNGYDNAEFILYDGLTHLFTKSPDNASYTVNDYAIQANIQTEVLEDIAKFISETQK